MEKLQPRLQEIETLLGDSSLYDAERKQDLLKLMDEQNQLKTKLEHIEEEMLGLMMELEELESSFWFTNREDPKAQHSVVLFLLREDLKTKKVIETQYKHIKERKMKINMRFRWENA